MDYLILHIDLDFISGVIFTSDNNQAFSLKSADNRDPERFWLFFENDQFNHRIRYKKEYRQKVFDKVPGFIGNFMLRDLKNESFLLDDQNYELAELLEVSGIISSIKSQFFEKTGNDLIKTMLAFSDNIPLSNKDAIVYFLNKKGFSIETCGIPLPELLCFHQKNNSATGKNAKIIFVLDAWNDNLNLSVLYKVDNYYTRQPDLFQTFPNMGKDPKQKIIVEYVVDSLSRETNFLRTRERKENEYKRQEKYAEDWLNRLALVDSLILQDITIANCSKTRYTITIERSEIELRTQRYITDVLTKFRALKNSIKANDDFIVLLSGEALSNSVIKRKFIEEVGVGKIMIFDTLTLKKVYAQYPELWGIAEAKISELEQQKRYETLLDEGDELNRSKQFVEALNRYQNARNIRNTKEVNNKINAVENLISYETKQKQEFNNLLTKSDNYAKLNKWIEARVCLLKALEIIEDDSLAISKLKDVDVNISIVNQRVRDFLRDAKEEYSKENWEKAKDFYSAVLDIQPDNKSAKENIENCERFILLGPIIKKADDLFSKHEYKEAQSEYQLGRADSYCVKKYIDCAFILKNLRSIRNIIIESKSLVASKNLQKLIIRFSELNKLIEEIRSADPTNKQCDEDVKKYEGFIESIKSNKNVKMIEIKPRPLQKDKRNVDLVKKSKTDIKKSDNEELNTSCNSGTKVLKSEVKKDQQKNEAERFFLTGRFIEAKRRFELEPPSKIIQDRIKQCIDLRKNEQHIKALYSEAKIIQAKAEKEKARIRTEELNKINSTYLSLGVTDERITEIFELFKRIK